LTEALNMKLETVRTVLRNEVNEIIVCVDKNRATDVFYTMISITSPPVRRQLAQRIGADGLFTSNSDFIGSFTRGEEFCLVFLYRPENRLSTHEQMYAANFVARKEMAQNLLIACAETQITGSVGVLLLDDRNINVGSDRSVYFNYFLDFKNWNPELDESQFYHDVGQTVFELLSREFEAKYAGDLDSYPSELQILYKKTQNRDFRSFSGILTFVKALPDEPRELFTGWRAFWEKCKDLWQWIKNHSMTIFVVAIIAVTMGYLAYQIIARISASKAIEKNVTYAGMDNIGEVYLGDEDI